MISILVPLLLGTPLPPSEPGSICDAMFAGIEAASARQKEDFDQGLNGQIVFSSAGVFCGQWTVVTIFSKGSGESVRWIMRKTKASPLLPNEAPKVSWAEARSCPQILDALEALEKLTFGFTVNQPIRPPPKEPPGPPKIPPPPPPGRRQQLHHPDLLQRADRRQRWEMGGGDAGADGGMLEGCRAGITPALLNRIVRTEPVEVPSVLLDKRRTGTSTSSARTV
jgi:hypothetical protein